MIHWGKFLWSPVVPTGCSRFQRLMVDWLSQPISVDLCREKPVDTAVGHENFREKKIPPCIIGFRRSLEMTEKMHNHLQDWKKLLRSGVQLSVSRHHGAKFRAPLTPSVHHSIIVLRGWRRAFIWSPIMPRDAIVFPTTNVSFSVWIHTTF